MKKKGFTLMELIIVIAIFGILVAVITPSWTLYLQRSKFRTYNQKAKTVFNAAQTVITEMEFSERSIKDRRNKIMKESNIDTAEVAALEASICTPLSGGRWFFYYDGVTGRVCFANGTSVIDSDGAVPDDSGYTKAQITAINDWSERISQAIGRIVWDDMVYKIWVEDYHVVSVACAERANSRFIGAHPTTIYELDAEGVDTDDLQHTTVREVDLSWFDLDNSNDGTLITGT